ncbi:hypothetical protein [Herbidospora cretacea]|uniref:hypothetical protein n=1 Tax=Herbidospora cretacea TaxID=28444 RepID=UPI0007732150|nr:hypothetical protein [Herbidospora cretacea]
MGVELITDDEVCSSAVWDSSFDHYGLEIFPEPMTAHLLRIGEAFGSAAVDVTGHPRWSALVGKKLTHIEIVWSEDQGAVRTPYAVRLRSRETAVWIAVGRPEDGFLLGTDDVVVVFTAAFAAGLGISP